MKKFLLVSVCLLALTACSQGQAEKEKLQQHLAKALPK